MLEYFNFRVIFDYLPLFLEGFLSTGWISLISLFLCLVVGTVACAARLSQSRLFSTPAAVYIESIRSTPLLAQLYFFYFASQPGLRLPEIQTGILALMLNSGAYMAEILRAGAVHQQRTDRSGHFLGLSYFNVSHHHPAPGHRGDHSTSPGAGHCSGEDSASAVAYFHLRAYTDGSSVDSSGSCFTEGFFTGGLLSGLVLFLKYLSNWWQGRLIFRQRA
jgi:polar amino acid transport system permease protein